MHLTATLRLTAMVLLAATLIPGLLIACETESPRNQGGGGGGGGGGNAPQGVAFLADGYTIERFLDGLNAPVKMAVAPDGRVFFNELRSGAIRVVRADGTLEAAPFAVIGVLQGSENGLIGLALDPDFASNRYLYVQATVGSPNRQQVIRFTDNGGLGEDRTVIINDLPQSAQNNAGNLLFLRDGTLVVSVGDTERPDMAQQDGALQGRLLRYTRDGAIPADNPDAASPEIARGLRNPFDTTLHHATGGIVFTDNGPTENDKLLFLNVRGKNFGWPAFPPDFPGRDEGIAMAVWPVVIAPTGVMVHTGAGSWRAFENSVFLLSYTHAEVRHLPMSGAEFTDIDSEDPIVRFVDETAANKPIDILELPNGDLLVSTLTGIWRISRS